MRTGRQRSGVQVARVLRLVFSIIQSLISVARLEANLIGETCMHVSSINWRGSDVPPCLTPIEYLSEPS